MVRLPVNVFELLNKIKRVSARLNAQSGRKTPASHQEIGAFQYWHR